MSERGFGYAPLKTMICATKLFLYLILEGTNHFLWKAVLPISNLCTLKANDVFIFLITSIYARVST